MRLKPWTLTQLAREMKEDLAKCNTDFERSMCESICKKEMLDLAEDIIRTRKLTPGEQSILDSI